MRPQPRTARPHDPERRLRFAPRDQPDTRPDVAVARAASRSWGILTLDELRGCGLSRAAVAARASSGRLHREYRGVYAVGYPAVVLEACLFAAVKACGPRGVLSHVSAGVLLGLLRWVDGGAHHVEADGAAWHDGRLAREADADRQALLEAHGDRVLRVTWRQAVHSPGQTAARLRAAGVPPAGLARRCRERCVREDRVSSSCRVRRSNRHSASPGAAGLATRPAGRRRCPALAGYPDPRT